MNGFINENVIFVIKKCRDIYINQVSIKYHLIAEMMYISIEGCH